jgi:hypothetical protein
VRVKRVGLDFAIGELFATRVHITALYLDDACKVLKIATEKPQPPDQAPISLAALLSIQIDTMHVKVGGFTKNSELPLEFDTDYLDSPT